MQLVYRGSTYEMTPTTLKSSKTRNYQGIAPMQLVYRGSTYQMMPATIESSDTELTGKYRGLPTMFQAPMGVAQPQAVAVLTYRGNRYLRLR